MVPVGRTPSRHPAVERDLAIVVPEARRCRRGRGRHRGGTAARCCATSRLFDIYRGRPLDAARRASPSGSPSRADDRTLTEAEVEAAVAAVIGGAGRRRRPPPDLSGRGPDPTADRRDRHAAALRRRRAPLLPLRRLGPTGSGATAAKEDWWTSGTSSAVSARSTCCIVLYFMGFFVLGFAQGTIRRLIGIASILFSFLFAANLAEPLGDFLGGELDAVPPRSTAT